MEYLLYRALSRINRVGWLLTAAAVAAAAPPQSQTLCGQVPTIAAELTQISKLPLKHPVPCDFITKEKVNEFLRKRVQEDSKPEEIRAEELTLKKFGFVPQDFDLAKSTIDLLTEQAAAFYDYNKKKLFITETSSKEPQEPVLAHELSHAIADQNFNLAKFVKAGRKSDDGSTARLAVMEGQATWLMSEYLARKNGQSLESSPDLVAAMSSTSDAGDGSQFPVYDKSPLYLRLTLIFPYTKGMLFQDAVLRRDKEASFSEVFRNPPLSTQQILHPDKYFSGVKPTDPQVPDPHLHGYKGLVGGSLGELEHQILLEQYGSKEESADIAPHWRGCNFELLENKKAGRVVLLYASEWDSEESARKFFTAYRETMQKKWRKMTVASETADRITGSGDDGNFVLERKGALVTSMEGLDSVN
ncbi:MAG TPA: hypothetical protein VG456_02470 [Candidatus Sulfopaludibacter sp.]|jgi:hypothetical protein|nr:hypothetical protein [Candidatus Sulfopaludibacter sp.]